MKLIIRYVLLFVATVSFAETEAFSNRLSIPPLLDYTYLDTETLGFKLNAGADSVRFLPELTTPTFGYNGSYLGPTIRFSRNQRIEIAVENNLGEPTTVHWHGLHVPGEMDGGPHQVIQPGAIWTAKFTAFQEAATLWYHPHLLGRTGEQAYMGLSGLIIIDDENSKSLDLPGNYGVDDIPLVIQDRRFLENGEFAYITGMPDVMHGVIGNVILVNGVHEPFLDVERGPVRFRILNGSDSTIHRYKLSDGLPFYQIATDGGFLESPLQMESIILSPGERAEIVVDF